MLRRLVERGRIALAAHVRISVRREQDLDHVRAVAGDRRVECRVRETARRRRVDVRAVLQEDLGRVQVPEESGQAEGRETFRVRRVDPRAGLSQDRLQPAGVAGRGRLVNPERVFRRAFQEEAERSGGPVVDRGEDEGPVRRAHPEDEGIPVEDAPDVRRIVFLHRGHEFVLVGHRLRPRRRVDGAGE